MFIEREIKDKRINKEDNMNNIYDTVAQVFAEHNQPMDDFVGEVAVRIWEDNRGGK